MHCTVYVGRHLSYFFLFLLSTAVGQDTILVLETQNRHKLKPLGLIMHVVVVVVAVGFVVVVVVVVVFPPGSRICVTVSHFFCKCPS